MNATAGQPPLAGTFTLRSVAGGTTGPLPYDVSAAAVGAAIRKGTMGETFGDVLVSRSGPDLLNAYAWTVTFVSLVGARRDSVRKPLFFSFSDRTRCSAQLRPWILIPF